MPNAIVLGSPPIQKKIKSTSVNYNVFSDTNIATELLRYNGLTSETMKKKAATMKVVFLPDNPCTVVVNGSEYDAVKFYSTGELTSVKSFLIKETGISGLIIITIN